MEEKGGRVSIRVMQHGKHKTDRSLLTLKVEEGATAKECGQPLEFEKGQENGFSLEPSEGNAALMTP